MQNLDAKSVDATGKATHYSVSAVKRRLLVDARNLMRRARTTRDAGEATALRTQAARERALVGILAKAPPAAASQLAPIIGKILDDGRFRGPHIPHFPNIPGIGQFPFPFGGDSGADLAQQLDSAFGVGQQWRYEHLRELAVKAAQDAAQYESQLLQIVQLAESKLGSAEVLLGPVLTDAANKLSRAVGTVENLSHEGAIADALDQAASTATRYLVLALLLEWLVTNDVLDFWVGLFSAVIHDVANGDFDLGQTKAYIDASTPADLVDRVTGLADEIDTRLADIMEPLRQKVRSLLTTTGAALDEVFGAFDLPLAMVSGPHDGADIANVNPLAHLEADLTAAVDSLERELRTRIDNLLQDPAGLKKLLRDMIIDFIILPVLAVVGVAFILGGVGAALLAAVLLVGAEELVHLLASWLSGPLLDGLKKLKSEILGTLDRVSERITSALPALTENDPTAILNIVGSQLRELRDALPEVFLEDAAALLEAARDTVLDGATQLALAAERALGLENATAFDKVDMKATPQLRGSPQLPGTNDPHLFGGALLLREVHQLERDRTQIRDGREMVLSHRISLLDALGTDQLTTLLTTGELVIPLVADQMLAPHYPGLYRCLIKEVRPSIVLSHPDGVPLGVSVPMTLTHVGPSSTRIKRSANPAAPPSELPPSLQDSRYPAFVDSIGTTVRLAIILAVRRVLSRFHRWAELVAVLPPIGVNRVENVEMGMQAIGYQYGPVNDTGTIVYAEVRIPNAGAIADDMLLVSLALSSDPLQQTATRTTEYLGLIGRTDLANDFASHGITEEMLSVALDDELDVVLPRLLGSIADGRVSPAAIKAAVHNLNVFSGVTPTSPETATARADVWTRTAMQDDTAYVGACLRYLQDHAPALAAFVSTALDRVGTSMIDPLTMTLDALWTGAQSIVKSQIAKWGTSRVVADANHAAAALGFATLTRDDPSETSVHLLTLVGGALAQAVDSVTSSDGTPPGVATLLRYRPFENRGFDGALKIVLPAAVQRARAGTISPSLGSIVSGNLASNALSNVAVIDVLLDVVVRACWDNDLAATVTAQPSLALSFPDVPLGTKRISETKRVVMSARARASDIGLPLGGVVGGVAPLQLGSGFTIGLGRTTATNLLGITETALGFPPGTLPVAQDVEVLGVGVAVIPMRGTPPPQVAVSGGRLGSALGINSGPSSQPGPRLLALTTKRRATPDDPRPVLSLDQLVPTNITFTGGNATKDVYDVLVSMTYRLKQPVAATPPAVPPLPPLAPVLLPPTPAAGQVGTALTLTGIGFPANRTGVVVRVGSVLVDATSDASGAVAIVIPSVGSSAPAIANISIAFPGLPETNSVSFVVEPAGTIAAVRILGVSPTTWAIGTTINVTGQSFLVPPAQIVRLNGVILPDWTFDSASAFHFTIPPTANTAVAPTLTVENTLGSDTFTGATWGTPPPPPTRPTVTSTSYTVHQATPTFTISGSNLSSVTGVALLSAGVPLSAYTATFVINSPSSMTVTVHASALWLPTTLTATVQLQGGFTAVNAGMLTISP